MCYRTRIYCLQVPPCIFQPGNLAGWGSEGVKTMQMINTCMSNLANTRLHSVYHALQPVCGDWPFSDHTHVHVPLGNNLNQCLHIARHENTQIILCGEGNSTKTKALDKTVVTSLGCSPCHKVGKCVPNILFRKWHITLYVTDDHMPELVTHSKLCFLQWHRKWTLTSSKNVLPPDCNIYTRPWQATPIPIADELRQITGFFNTQSTMMTAFRAELMQNVSAALHTFRVCFLILRYSAVPVSHLRNCFERGFFPPHVFCFLVVGRGKPFQNHTPVNQTKGAGLKGKCEMFFFLLKLFIIIVHCS